MLVSTSKSREFLLAYALAALVTMTLSSPAKATIIASGLSISGIGLVDSSTTLAYVVFNNILTGHNCTIPPGGQGHNRMFFDFTTTRGKAIMSLLTAAQLSGKKVLLKGDNVCLNLVAGPNETNTVTESIKWLRIDN